MPNQTKKPHELVRLREKGWLKKLEATPVSIKDGSSGTPRYVYLLLDCSGSMADGDKLGQAKRGANGFAKSAIDKGYAVGLISFESEAKHILSPVTELAVLATKINGQNVGGSTNLANAILISSEYLRSRVGGKAICIVTDGMPDDEKQALYAATVAKNAGIEILTIGTDDADKRFLEKLATRSELAAKVERASLEAGITEMVKLLPHKE